MSPRWRHLIVGLVVLAPAILSLLATDDGLAIGQRDGPIYLASAESLAAGDGFTVPFGQPGDSFEPSSITSRVSHYPPGYPGLLAAGVAAGLDVESIARLVGSVSVAMIALVLYRMATYRGHGLLASSAFGLLGGVVSLPYALGAGTEAIYGALLVVGLALISRYQSASDSNPVVALAVVASLSVVVRFVGLVLVATALLVVALTPRPKRWLNTAIVAGLGTVAVALTLAATGGSSRSLAWHPPTVDDLAILANTVAQWLVPPVFGPELAVALLVLVLAVSSWLLYPATRRADPARNRRVLRVYPGIVYAGAHVLSLFATATLFDIQTRPSFRLMFPALLALLAAATAVDIPSEPDRLARRARVGAGILAAGVFAAAVWSFAEVYSTFDEGGREYRSSDFAGSVAVDTVRNLARTSRIVSNVPEGLWVAGVERVVSAPSQVDPWSGEANAELSVEMSRLEELIEGGAVVFYYRAAERDYLVSERQLSAIAPCEIFDQGAFLILSSEGHAGCPAA